MIGVFQMPGLTLSNILRRVVIFAFATTSLAFAITAPASAAEGPTADGQGCRETNGVLACIAFDRIPNSTDFTVKGFGTARFAPNRATWVRIVFDPDGSYEFVAQCGDKTGPAPSCDVVRLPLEKLRNGGYVVEFGTKSIPNDPGGYRHSITKKMTVSGVPGRR
jgi:hypothetical protein